MGYKTVGGHAEAEFTDRKSRFIGKIWHVESEEEIRAILDAVRKECWDASHNVYAYRVGLSPETERFSDDGEPGGTSGLPTLAVLRGAELRNVLVITTRYFGGTLLGTGGLVRAYTEAARLAVEAAGTVTREEVRVFRLPMDYTALGRIQYLLAKEQYQTVGTEYTDRVTLSVLVPLAREEAFLAQIREESEGRISPEGGEPFEAELP